uniref:DNMT1-RFD domain-containing protein n=1 Tax=Steinernema glaseri TaxID=37863 RepID=A0A1I7ZBC5_9BILA
MDAVPLDFVECVVNLLSYDDRCNEVSDKRHWEPQATAFSRLSQPWSEIAASLKECYVYVCGDSYSIHEMEEDEQMDILSWNPRKHVVRELSFAGKTPCECDPACERPLSADVFRRLRN